MRLKLLVSYIGTRYHGWQRQQQGKATVQGALEEAFFRLTGSQRTVTGSGRTDAGVHASGQVAHVDVPETHVSDWARALNAKLPSDIRVLLATPAAHTFHARFDALHKTYLYRFWTERRFLPPQFAPFVWNAGALNAEEMQKCLSFIQGRHDFASFQNQGSEVTSTVRTVLAVELNAKTTDPFLPPHAPLLTLTITANGFLKQMVRNIAGLLAAVGRGKITSDCVLGILEAIDRAQNPCPTAPAQGLTLAKVSYREEITPQNS